MNAEISLFDGHGCAGGCMTFAADFMAIYCAPGTRRRMPRAQIDIVRAGACRVKRVIYPPGFRWSTHMQAIVGRDLCMHAHVRVLPRGQIHLQYGDGCNQELVAAPAVAIEPGHDG